MKTKEKISTVNEFSKTEFFKTVLEDKKKMHEHIQKYGSLCGFRSKNFKFAKPLSN